MTNKWRGLPRTNKRQTAPVLHGGPAWIRSRGLGDLQMHLEACTMSLIHVNQLMGSLNLSWSPSDLIIARSVDPFARQTTALYAGKYKLGKRARLYPAPTWPDRLACKALTPSTTSASQQGEGPELKDSRKANAQILYPDAVS